MIKTIYLIIIFVIGMFLISCKFEKNKIQRFERFIIDKNLNKNDTFNILSKLPELKLYNSEIVESKTRTAYIIQTANYSAGFYHTKPIVFEDYKCKAAYKGDTIEIILNNNNGYFGNGVLVKVFNNEFLIKDIDPKTMRGEMKLMNSSPTYQKLILNKAKFQKNDSIYGFIKYKTKIDSSVTKHFQGYFRTKIK